MHEVYSKYFTRAARRQVWIALVQAWHQSGLTAKQYCQRKDIKEADLRRWSSRLKRMQSNLAPTQKISAVASATFIPITLTSPAVKQDFLEPCTIDLRLGNNLTIQVRKPLDENLLLQLLQVLRRAESC